MPLSICCRNALVSVSVIILLVAAGTMLGIGIPMIGGDGEVQDAEMRKYDLKVGIILLVFGVVALVATILILWLCCCFRQRAPKWLFILGLVVTDLVLVTGVALMLLFGSLLLIDSDDVLWRGVLLISFSVVPIGAAIGIPIYCCYRRKRQIREEEEEEEQQMNEWASPNNTETTLSVVPLTDGKVSV